MKLTILLLAAVHLPAATVYHTRPFFEAALVSPTHIDFEGLAPSGGDAYFGGSGLTISGVNIDSPEGQLYAISSTSPLTTSLDAGLGTGDYMEGGYHSCCTIGDTRFNLPSGTMAFGLDFRSFNQTVGPNGSAGSFTLQILTTGGPIILTDGTGGSQFFGYIADDPILAVVITPNGDNPNSATNSQFLHFDNVTFSSDVVANSETPEPRFTALAGLLLLPLLRLLHSSNRHTMFSSL